MARLLLQNYDDWVRMALRENPRPSFDAAARLTPSQLDEVVAYNGLLGPVATHDTQQVAEAIAMVQRRNDRAVLNGQQCVVISGRSLDGKTYAAASAGLRDYRLAWRGRTPRRGQSIVAPWGYLEVEATHGLKGMAASLLRFLGAPVPARSTGGDLLHQLRLILPEVGMRGVIIDDAHGIAGANNAESRAFAGALKAMITGLPVTLVVVGINLGDSALAGARGDEVRMRAHIVTTGQWPAPFTSRRPGPWERLVANMSTLLELPGGEAARAGMRRREFVTTLADGCQGRPGLAIEWLKEAAEYAVTNRRGLDVAALSATVDYPRQRLGAVSVTRPARGRRGVAS